MAEKLPQIAAEVNAGTFDGTYTVVLVCDVL